MNKRVTLYSQDINIYYRVLNKVTSQHLYLLLFLTHNKNHIFIIEY